MVKDHSSILFSVNLHLKLCLGPAKLGSNADSARKNDEGMKTLRSLQTLPRNITEPSYFVCKIMEKCRHCPAKSRRHSFMGENNNKNYLKNDFLFFLSNFCYKSMLFQRSIQPLGQLFKGHIFCVMVTLNRIYIYIFF